MDRQRELSLLKTLRNVLDKMQVKVGVRFPLEEADLRRALSHAVAVIAAMTSENYNIATLPDDLEPTALLAAASKALADREAILRLAGGHADADALADIHHRLDTEIARKLKGKRSKDVQQH